MTQSPLEPPNENNPSTSAADTPRREDERVVGQTTGPSRPLTFDEVVALFVAFLSLGSVLLWGLTRGGIDLFSESLASADNSIVSSDEDGGAPFAFPLGSNNEATAGDVDQENARALADGNDGAGAVAGRDGLPARLPRERRSNNVWGDVKAGMAGAAAGITGVVVTPEETPAVPTPDPLPPVAADFAAAPLSAAATAPPKEAIQFADVPNNYWAKPYIDALSSRELISGFQDGDFKPEQPVTRAQIANIVSRTFELTADKENLEFADVTGDYWAKESIGEVVRGGFMTGFPNDTFAPNDPVTRAQALTTLVTGLGIEPPTNIQASLDRYADANTIPNWANEKMAAATVGGLVVNYPELPQLNPTQPTTRAELAAFLYQALAKQGVVEPIESEYLVKP
ncbi:MAG: S-layer homology domain [Phormidesmis priestleyi Ana]|uniref:S-layer homology domain n=1 Tax=Phormidesmis priestleyi Ana TaxID=1666911 RepID=A0A0P8BK57_9CYAN|nr:MAG: S-layer homology domain [Phormidesmis priestleyi Ana]